MIPADKQAIAGHALEAAFGVRQADAVTPLVAGDGLGLALVYRVEVQGRPYLLRFIKSAMPGVDPVRELDFMRRAADAGIAPKVWYASAEEGVMLCDFIDTQPFPPDAAPRLAETLRRLHALPGVAVSTHYLDAMDRFVKRLGDSELLPREAAMALIRCYEKASAVYPRDTTDWVPCHHDLKPPNMLYDGERFWLIDWEAAFLDDRYVDLAIAAPFVAHSEAETDGFLATYFGQPPNEDQRARFFLMSQLVSAFYVAVFGGLAAHAGLPWEEGGATPSFEAFNRGIAAGEFDLGQPEAMRSYAKAHLARALAAMESPRFAEAVARVKAQHVPIS